MQEVISFFVCPAVKAPGIVPVFYDAVIGCCYGVWKARPFRHGNAFRIRGVASGVDIVRVHDVREMVEGVRVADAIRGDAAGRAAA